MKKRISIMGIGEIGEATLEDMHKIIELKKLNYEIIGIDIDKKRLENLKRKYPHIKFYEEIAESEIYVISVYSSDQVEKAIKSIPKHNKPLIIIESTISMGCAKIIKELWDLKKDFYLVSFPHRFNPNDPEHRVFNLNRVLGGIDNESINKFLEVYENFIDKDNIFVCDFNISVLSKIVENSHRFMEIAFSEELKMECDRLGVDFEKLRRAANTKWNIDIKEARGGINSKCLPKDTGLFNEYFNKNQLIKDSIKIDIEYKDRLGK